MKYDLFLIPNNAFVDMVCELGFLFITLINN